MKKLLAILFLTTFSLDVLSQRKQKKKNKNSNQISYEIPDIKWRSIGPYRVDQQQLLDQQIQKALLFWCNWRRCLKTTNSGVTWKNISDGYFGGSIGAVTASESDPNIIYVGTGEKTVRGNVSPGYGGFWKSDDAGETWKKMNLNIDQVQVGRIAVHPKTQILSM